MTLTKPFSVAERVGGVTVSILKGFSNPEKMPIHPEKRTDITTNAR
jgi:hypothetical protein